jgi:hypothetical protein
VNKKTNTLLFILGGTVFNIIVTILSFTTLLLIYGKFFANLLPERGAAYAIPVIFVASIIASFFIYRLVIRTLFKKVDMGKYFDPIFKQRRFR